MFTKIYSKTTQIVLLLSIALLPLVSCADHSLDRLWEEAKIRHVVYKAGDCTGNFTISNLPQDETEYVLADKPTLKAKPTCSNSSEVKEFTAWQIEGSDSDGRHQPNDAISFSRPDEGFTATAIWGSVQPLNPPPPSPHPIPMRTVPTNGSTTITFPMGINDTASPAGTINHKFAIAKTEVTYELWYEVRVWAESQTGTKKYTFINKGIEGHDGTAGATPTAAKNEPVTKVNGWDAIVWCNAYTEWYNAEKGDSLMVVYVEPNNPAIFLRDANRAKTLLVTSQKPNATGFRLPTSQEWEFAARLRKDTTNCVKTGGSCKNEVIGATTYYYTKGNSASGTTANFNNTIATGKVAWYKSNSSNSSHNVKEKAPNALGIYDMSGNVREWCFDTNTQSARVSRGGSWSLNASHLQVGDVFNGSPDHMFSNLGFRVVRTQ